MRERPGILIVDDTPENIQVLVETLRSEYRISAAISGVKALELVEKNPLLDLILLDVMMPDMDGYEVCVRLKASEKTKDIPVIFVTALAEAGDEARGLELGAVDYITKPINPSLVRARVHNQVELKLHRDRLEELVEEKTRELISAITEKERLAAQLEMARDLQQAMLPPRSFKNSRCEIAALVEPATQVGGDLYDYFPVDDRRVLFLIGDVSGKGVPAALFMSRALTVIRSIIGKNAVPSEILAQANRELSRNNDSCMFVTACCGILDTQTGEIEISSAGHERPVLLGPRDEATLIRIPGGPPLGIDESSEYPEHRFRLSAEQLLLLYTDGITDAENRNHEFFTETRFLGKLPELAAHSAEEVRDGLLREVRGFADGAPQSDDITLLALRLTGEGTARS